MENVGVLVEQLLNYAQQAGLMEQADRVYCANRLYAKLGLCGQEGAKPEKAAGQEVLDSPAQILNGLCDYAAQKGLLTPDTVTYRDIFDTELMDCVMPLPSTVLHTFGQKYAESPEAATDYYYALSKASNYIRTDRVKKDLAWETDTPYGKMRITINLSKPEKDPKDIAAAKALPQTGYPKCALCRENEGFMGSAAQAPRANHRLIPLQLDGETWYLQYSPYVYYNEHCIVLNGMHTQMKISDATFRRQLEFVTKFPHYFVGSNADLPIVGGSILTHDHFQGGRFDFPMAKAPLRQKIEFSGFPGVEAGLVRWPMSVVRIKSEDPPTLCRLAGKILCTWRGYSDEAAQILAFTGQTPHNTVTPICRRRGSAYELDLVLRNNRTTPEHPLGLFHPHSELHHIKKENIGLIEVMGLAVLPARLRTELSDIGALLHSELQAWENAGRPAQYPVQAQTAATLQGKALHKHEPWFYRLLGMLQAQCETIPVQQVLQQINDVVYADVGRIFARVLCDAGVYKDDAPGHAAFDRFIDAVNAKEGF